MAIIFDLGDKKPRWNKAKVTEVGLTLASHSLHPDGTLTKELNDMRQAFFTAASNLLLTDPDAFEKVMHQYIVALGDLDTARKK